MNRISLYLSLVLSSFLACVSLAQLNLSHRQMADISQYLREEIRKDPHRPTFHFVMPESNAAPFDPNGAMFWKGRYHLGFIYQKLRNGKYEHVWGHAVSTDLLHWTLYPDMLNVKDGDLEKGIFSGGAFVSKEGVPHIIYHGEGGGVNLIAYSTDDDLRTWNKSPLNPALRSGEGKVAWDPEAWYDSQRDCYYQISGGKPATFFKSEDGMKTWQYIGQFIGDSEAMHQKYEDISCPDFFKISKDKYMLLFISHYNGARYYIGSFKNDKFAPEKFGKMNWPGGTFFAPEQLRAPDGRNIFFAWILERKPKDYGWGGIMSLPRVASLDERGDLKITPAKELQNLRISESKDADFNLAKNSEKVLSARGKSLEISLDIDPKNSEKCGIKVFASDEEETLIYFDSNSGQMVVDFKNSSKLRKPVKFPSFCMMIHPPAENLRLPDLSEQRSDFALKRGEKLKLRAFIDRSVIEVFVNDRLCMTQVVYPDLQESDKIKVFCEGGTVEVKNVKVWNMAETNFF